MYLAGGGAMVALLLRPIGQAIAQRLGRRAPGRKTGLSTGEMTVLRVAELEARLAELEAAPQAQVVELPERLEFAERVIARLPGASGVPQPAAMPPAN
jgi:hypothetical protein